MAVAAKSTSINQATSAYLRLERLLVTLELTPGAMMSESDLIEMTKMGRTPVREAVQRLESDGLMFVRPRAGIMIANINAADFLKVLELRRVLEPILAETATQNANADHREKIALCHDMMAEAVASKNIKLFLDADKMFDRLLVDAADNPFLEKILGPLQTHARRFWFHYVGELELEQSATLHMPIMDAFATQKPKLAADMMHALVDEMIASAKQNALD